MKKILLLLLCSAVITMFVSCNNNAKNNGEKPPVDTTAKPALGYIDFKNWHDIMLKDIETVKPLIKGVYIKDTVSGKKKILVYTHNTDCGTFRTEYRFNSKNILVEIAASIYSGRDTLVLKTPKDVLKYCKIISDEMNTYVKSITDRGRLSYSGFSMYKKNDVLKFFNNKQTYDQGMYKLYWEYLARIENKDIEDDESFHGTEMWQIKDDVLFPDGQTPEIIPVIMYGSSAIDGSYDTFKGRSIDVQFNRFGVFEDNDITNPDI